MTYQIISTVGELSSLCKELETASVIAIDTEFTRISTYYPILSLLQLTFKEKEAIIVDCLAIKDLSPLMNILYKDNIVKVFHGSKQDLEILYYYNNAFPKNIFDTQIAMMALNHKHDLSYDKMVKIFCNIDLDKNINYNLWNKRPLEVKQLEYAANDVIYLYDSYLIIKDIISNKGKDTWLNEAFDELINYENYNKRLEKDLKQLSYHQFSNEKLSLACNILKWRENLAKTENKPLNHILSLENVKSLLEIPDYKEKIINSMINKISDNYIKDLISIMECPPINTINIPQVLSLSKTEDQDSLSLLKILLKKVARDNQINELLITNQNELVSFILQKEESKASFLKNWKYEIFGKDALDLINGTKSLKIINNQISII